MQTAKKAYRPFLQVGYKFSQVISFLESVVPTLKKVEISIDDIVLPEVMSYRNYMDSPKEDFIGKMVKEDKEENIIQIIDGEKAKYSIYDLVRTYKKLYKNEISLVVFGVEDNTKIEYFFIKTNNPYDTFIPPAYFQARASDPEWERPNVIESRIQDILAVYSGYAEKIIFIGSQKSRFFNFKEVTFLDLKSIKTLFDLTIPVQTKKEYQSNVLNQYFIPLILPLISVFILGLHVPSYFLEKERKEVSDLNKQIATKEIDVRKKEQTFKDAQEKLKIKKEVYQ